MDGSLRRRDEHDEKTAEAPIPYYEGDLPPEGAGCDIVNPNHDLYGDDPLSEGDCEDLPEEAYLPEDPETNVANQYTYIFVGLVMIAASALGAYAAALFGP